MPRLSTTNKKMVQCKKHPKHKQSPGVCSLCLGEKLSRVSTTTISTASRDGYASGAREYYCSSSSLSSSEDESSYASSTASPPMHEEEEVRNMMKYLSKSKSMPLDKAAEDDDSNNKKRVFGGFWTKFLRPRRSNVTHHFKNVGNNIVSNEVYMSQPLDVASSSRMAVC